MNDKQMHSRRIFLQAAIATSLAGCRGPKEPEISPEQRAGRRTAPSTVGIIKCTYEDDLFGLVKSKLNELDLPSLKGQSVVLKVNMVDFREGKPLTTDTKVIEAGIKLADYLGAKQVTVAEGPANHRDTELLLEQTGIGSLCRKLGVPFVDLNLDDLEVVANPQGFTKLKEIHLPKTIVDADCVVSLPKLKTHHWVGMTACLKNFFGVVPGRKYGWPKNILHWAGIDQSIVDLVRLVKPKFALADAVVAMEGEGPFNGVPKNSGFIALGSDLAACDATLARTMELDPDLLYYLRLAGQVIGNTKKDKIKIVGSQIETVAQKFKLSETFHPKTGADAGSAFGI